MIRKKIGVDIDETIAASYWPILQFVNQESGRHAVFEDLTYHDWWEIPHIEPRFDKEEIIGYFRSFDLKFHDHENVLPLEGSIDALAQLGLSEYELIAITARNEEYARTGTLTWIEKHFPNTFSSVHFTSYINPILRKDKSTVCKELGIELMIEDNLDFALELAHHGISSFLLEKPWNKQRLDEHPLITKVKNWDEIRLHFV